jgi:anti-sigma B factor antagonist
MKREMTSSTRTVNQTTIVDVTGEIDLGSSPTLRKTLMDELQTTELLAINLSAVRYIDSSGIASLVEVLQGARKASKRLMLYGLTPAVMQVLQLTRLTGIFEIFGTEEQMLQS